jgi:ABC-type nitrate/sulfonate/bicarbonate transport system substrate-binding protein
MLTRRGTLLAAAASGLPRIAIGQDLPVLQTLRSTARSWLWLAEDYGRDGGFFAKAGIKVVSNASNRGNNLAALSGSGPDIVLGDPGEVCNARTQGLAVRSILQMVEKYATHVVLTQDAMKKTNVTLASPLSEKIAALRGLRLGTTGPAASPDNLFRWLAVQGGMDPNRDIRLVPITGGGLGMMAAIQQGVIDGFALSSPTSDIAVLKFGCAYLIDMIGNPPQFLDRWCYIAATVSDRTLAAKRELLVRYATGVALTLRSIRQDPERFKAFALPFLELDPAIVDRAWQSNRGIYVETPVPDEALFRKLAEFVSIINKTQGIDPLPTTLAFTSVFDSSIAVEAVRNL